jgi:hypothetical protein
MPIAAASAEGSSCGNGWKLTGVDWMLVYKRVQGNGDKEKMECLSARNIFLMGKKREEAWRQDGWGVLNFYFYFFTTQRMECW